MDQLKRWLIVLRFNKGFNNNSDLKTDSKYDRFGRIGHDM